MTPGEQSYLLQLARNLVGRHGFLMSFARTIDGRYVVTIQPAFGVETHSVTLRIQDQDYALTASGTPVTALDVAYSLLRRQRALILSTPRVPRAS
jgi:hypothetical protein